MTETNQPPRPTNAETISRRGFLRIGALAAAALLVPKSSFAVPAADRRFLSLLNRHTHERLRVCYFSEGLYDLSALDEINHILRDHRTGDVVEMDLELLDALWELTRRLKNDGPFHVFSGYRSPETNQMLRARTRGVARTSYHTVGKAVDVSLPGCRLSRLRTAAIQMGRGGVGFYPKPGFVHVDVGPVRTW